MTTAPREANAGNFRSFSRVSFGYLSINSPNTASQVKSKEFVTYYNFDELNGFHSCPFTFPLYFSPCS